MHKHFLSLIYPYFIFLFKNLMVAFTLCYAFSTDSAFFLILPGTSIGGLVFHCNGSSLGGRVLWSPAVATLMCALTEYLAIVSVLVIHWKPEGIDMTSHAHAKNDGMRRKSGGGNQETLF